jgi:hypothetical protein
MTDDTKSMSVVGYPTGIWRERVLALANGAKHALYGSGSPMLSDDKLIRAALALDRMREGNIAESAVVGIAVLFSPETDAQQSPETRELLATPLCRPWDDLANAVENNRRLLGFEPQSGDGPSEAECDHGVVFDEHEAHGLTSDEVRKRWPRFSGTCHCGFYGAAYASMAHYICGDW